MEISFAVLGRSPARIEERRWVLVLETIIDSLPLGVTGGWRFFVVFRCG
jgi:hypothetical protein